MATGIQFGCTKAVYFGSKVDPEVFHNMFNDYENFYEGSKQGSPAVYVVRLEREELVAAFGKVTSFCNLVPSCCELRITSVLNVC